MVIFKREFLANEENAFGPNHRWGNVYNGQTKRYLESIESVKLSVKNHLKVQQSQNFFFFLRYELTEDTIFKNLQFNYCDDFIVWVFVTRLRFESSA